MSWALCWPSSSTSVWNPTSLSLNPVHVVQVLGDPLGSRVQTDFLFPPLLFGFSWQCSSTTLCGSPRNSGWPWTRASGKARWPTSRRWDRKRGDSSPTCLSTLGKSGRSRWSGVFNVMKGGQMFIDDHSDLVLWQSQRQCGWTDNSCRFWFPGRQSQWVTAVEFGEWLVIMESLIPLE